MRVLVAGGAGYIGSHVVWALRDAGHQVTVADNLSTGLRSNLPTDCELIETDLSDPGAAGRLMKSNPEAAVLLAGAKAVGESMQDPGKYARNNLAAALYLVEELTRAGCYNLVFSSTAAVYGEPLYSPVDEEHPLDPQNFYGFTKCEVERLLGWYARLKGLRPGILRYFNAAGYDRAGRVTGQEVNPQNLIPRVLEVAAGRRSFLEVYGQDYPTRDGTGVRDYIHVSDLARAHVLGLEKLAAGDKGFTINLGSEKGLSVFEIIETARRVTGRPIPVKVTDRRLGDPAEVLASSKKAQQLLGWKAECSDPETLLSTAWAVYR